jgi:hypothetical protein
MKSFFLSVGDPDRKDFLLGILQGMEFPSTPKLMLEGGSNYWYLPVSLRKED